MTRHIAAFASLRHGQAGDLEAGHDARYVIATAALVAFPRRLGRYGRQIINCVMTHRPTTATISAAIAQSAKFTAIAHIIEGS